MSHTPDQVPQYAPVKYHDGRSPSAWTLSVGCMIGAVVAAFGAMGPHWTIIYVGAAICLVSIIVAAVLMGRGLSNRG